MPTEPGEAYRENPYCKTEIDPLTGVRAVLE